MNNAEAVNWLINITADIGKIEHQDLWHYEQALSEIREMLEDAPTIESEPHWIPCSEKLPEANGRYLVTRGLVAAGALWNRVYIANYSNLMGIKSVKIWWQGNVGKSDFERLDDVLAWMPLPEPYRKENR